jgi:hypothetical protein
VTIGLYREGPGAPGFSSHFRFGDYVLRKIVVVRLLNVLFVKTSPSLQTYRDGFIIETLAVGFKCKIHGVPLVCFCPACHGAVRSARKARASKRNGKLGGRPKVKR